MRAYRRRRGWAAWQTAVLQRAEFKDGFPSLESVQGESGPEARPAQSADLLRHNLRLWAASLGQLGEPADTKAR